MIEHEVKQINYDGNLRIDLFVCCTRAKMNGEKPANPKYGLRVEW